MANHYVTVREQTTKGTKQMTIQVLVYDRNNQEVFDVVTDTLLAFIPEMFRGLPTWNQNLLEDYLSDEEVTEGKEIWVLE